MAIYFTCCVFFESERVLCDSSKLLKDKHKFHKSINLLSPHPAKLLHTIIAPSFCLCLFPAVPRSLQKRTNVLLYTHSRALVL